MTDVGWGRRFLGGEWGEIIKGGGKKSRVDFVINAALVFGARAWLG